MTQQVGVGPVDGGWTCLAGDGSALNTCLRLMVKGSSDLHSTSAASAKRDAPDFRETYAAVAAEGYTIE